VPLVWEGGRGMRRVPDGGKGEKEKAVEENEDFFDRKRRVAQKMERYMEESGRGRPGTITQKKPVMPKRGNPVFLRTMH